MNNNTSKDKYSNFQNEKIIFSADYKAYNNKPPDEEVGRVSYSVLNGPCFDFTIKDIAYTIAKGVTVSPAIFIRERGIDGFYATQSIWLDFDSKYKIITPEKVYDMLKECGIQPNLFYNTYSHTIDHPKFRYVISLDQIIKNGYAYKYLLEGFCTFFTENDISFVDEGCVEDISRLFFATRPSVLVDEVNNEVIPIDEWVNDKQVIYYSNRHNKYQDIKLFVDSINKKPFDKNFSSGS